MARMHTAVNNETYVHVRSHMHDQHEWSTVAELERMSRRVKGAAVAVSRGGQLPD